MDKNELADILSELLIPLGFKKKGPYWVRNTSEVNTIINLQKSQFSNFFYVNYGYILNAVPLDTKTHVHYRLGSVDPDEQRRIDELLRLENTIDDNIRKRELKVFLTEKMIRRIEKVETEQDVLEQIKAEKTLSTIPLSVRQYFQLE